MKTQLLCCRMLSGRVPEAFVPEAPGRACMFAMLKSGKTCDQVIAGLGFITSQLQYNPHLHFCFQILDPKSFQE